MAPRYDSPIVVLANLPEKGAQNLHQLCQEHFEGNWPRMTDCLRKIGVELKVKLGFDKNNVWIHETAYERADYLCSGYWQSQILQVAKKLEAVKVSR